MAYAIRVADAEGRTRRETFAAYRSLTFRINLLRGDACLDLADCLEEAREWAKIRIKSLKTTPEQELSRQRRRIRRELRFLETPLDDFVSKKIEIMRKKGRSEAYTDRLDKIFRTIVPEDLRHKSLGDVAAADLVNAILLSRSKPGSMAILRGFMGGVLDDAASHSWKMRSIHREYIDIIRHGSVAGREGVKFPELAAYENCVYEKLFKKLEAESEYWQQARCIRLYFEVSAPLSRLMALSRRQIFKGDLFLYFPRDTKFWYLKRVNLSKTAKKVLENALDLGNKNFPGTEFVFPSSHARQFKHIRSVDSMWRNVLFDEGLPFFPLRQFVESYRGPRLSRDYPHRPSYGRDLREPLDLDYLSRDFMWAMEI